jgi:Zn-dependent alcohol dehydrogenase
MCPLLQFMGIVEDVGDQVKNVKKGDRVVAAFDLGCGSCMCASCPPASATCLPDRQGVTLRVS